MPPEDEYIAGGFDSADPGVSTSTLNAPADTGGAPPTNANGSSSSGGFLDTVNKYGKTVLDTAKTYFDFETARGKQAVDLETSRSALEAQRSKASSDQQVALLQGRANVAAAQAKANEAQAAAARAAGGSFADQLSSGKYNTLMIALTLAGLGFAYLQSVRHE